VRGEREKERGERERETERERESEEYSCLSMIGGGLAGTILVQKIAGHLAEKKKIPR
jgi:hypothetical protein